MNELWIQRDVQQDGRKQRLFCFPFAGGGASVFRDWSAGVPSAVQVCRIQLPGRENRLNEPAFTTLSALIEALLRVMLPVLIQQPFAFFGHSMGGIIAFELTRQLVDRGYPLPEKLFLSATRPPHIADPAPIHHLPEPDFIEALHQRGGTPVQILNSPVFAEIFAPALRCDLAIAENWYHPEIDALPVPLIILNGIQDNIVKSASAETWRRYSHSEPCVVNFDAGHFFIHSHSQEVRLAVFSRLHDFPE